MDKLRVLLIVLLVAVWGLAVSMYALALFFGPTGSPLDVLVQLFLGNFPPGFSFFIPLSSLLFLCTVLASVVGVIYFLVLPEMKEYLGPALGNGGAGMVMRTLKPEEKLVVEVLMAHGGTYLQKYIRQETGLSRLKTHRVVATLSERGIVSVKKSGNTNEVSLARWFVEDA
jgi:hypothetical protein